MKQSGEKNVGPPKIKSIIVRVSPGVHRTLRLLSLDEERPMQALLEEGIGDLLRKYRRRVVA